MANENEDNIQIPDEVRQAMAKDSKTSKSEAANPKTPKQPTAGYVPTDEVQKTEYPSEVVDLPSDGYFYDQASPLASGKIDIKYMTAKEEDILTSQNLIKKGVVLDKLLEELIVTPGVKLDDILIGDKNALF